MAFPFNFKFPHTEYHARQENSEYPYTDYHIIDLDWFVEQIKSLWEYIAEHIVNFPLTLDKGGTGATTAADARTNLGLGAVATDNKVPISRGGTNATTAAGARTNLGLGAVATENVIPVSKGGTGATTAAGARENLGIEETTVSFPITIQKGGTGAEDAATARTNLGLGTLATLNRVPITNGGTNATSIAGALTNLGLEDVAHLDTFTTATDLNTLTAPGCYTFANSATNKPANDGGVLYLVTAQTYTYQIAISYNNIYIRRKASSQSWGSWYKIIKDLDVIPVARGGTGATNAADARTNLGIITPSDYVVSNGTTDGWQWEKWSSGKCIARRLISGTCGAYTAWGSGYYVYIPATAIPNGIFSTVSHFNATLNYSMDAFLGFARSNTGNVLTATNFPSLMLCRFTSNSGGEYSISAEVIGTWE